MAYLAGMDPETGYLDVAATRDVGQELNAGYRGAQPFPHAVIDDFMPEALLDRCLDEFEASRNDTQTMFDRAQEKLKRQYSPDQLSDQVRGLFYAFNSRPFIRVLENITGIAGLVPDPYFLGGGFHEIHSGGHLSVHADFNHHRPMDLERRINVLIYLNKDWQDSFGGQLELWDEQMRACVRSVVPSFNRCVIFNTTSNSNHGNPHPVAHPDARSRKSIALYYYTATWSETKRSHTTQFRARGGTGDQTDWRTKLNELYAEVLPPIFRRALAKGARGVGRLARRDGVG